MLDDFLKANPLPQPGIEPETPSPQPAVIAMSSNDPNSLTLLTIGKHNFSLKKISKDKALIFTIRHGEQRNSKLQVYFTIVNSNSYSFIELRQPTYMTSIKHHLLI